MKILFAIDTMTKGGAERVISNLSNYLIEDNKVEILTLLDRECAYELNEKIKFHSLKISEKKKNIFEKVIYTLKNVKKYIKQIEQIEPDIIISFLPRSSYYAIIASMKNKIKILVSERNDPNEEYKNAVDRLLMNILYKRATGFIFQTEQAQHYYNKKIQQRSVIIPNPIDEKFLCEPYKHNRRDEIVTAGRLTEQKNQIMLINAFEIVKQKYPQYILKIYGDGPLKDELQEIIFDKKLEKSVFLSGITNNLKEDIYESGIFVMSSNYEGMPNALMEAMAMGIPVVSTDCPCGGPKFLIGNNENGLLVKVNDTNNMANAIIRLIDDKDLAQQLSNNAHKKLETMHPNIINDKWKKYIYSIENNNN
ncbi:MAG: glycosyltransferase family 4 protein [Clostridia bacterium]|nr:glycosyltransferase family 4 protein [Clostridia bacterium]